MSKPLSTVGSSPARGSHLNFLPFRGASLSPRPAMQPTIHPFASFRAAANVWFVLLSLAVSTPGLPASGDSLCVLAGAGRAEPAHPAFDTCAPNHWAFLPPGLTSVVSLLK